MMKNVLVILTFLLSVVLTGCGSNSKPDGAGGGSGGTPIANYSLVAVPDVVDISAVGETKTLKLYLNDNNALQPVEGKVIRANVFDQNFGTLASYALTTDANGYVGFEYTAPETTLPNTSLVITFQLENSMPVLEKNVTVSFSGSTGPVSDLNTTGYQLVGVPDFVEIAEGGETANINLYLNDMVNLFPVANTVIKAQVFDQTNGILNTYEVATDSNGHAPFLYTAPNSLPATSLVITFEVKGGTPALEKNVTVSFNGSTGPVSDLNTTSYELVAVPNSVSILNPGESRALSLYLSNTVTQSPVADQQIKALWFDPNNGTLNSYIASTNSNGQAVFNYTAPLTIDGSVDFDITFEVLGGTPILDANVTVHMGAAAGDGVDTTDMQLWVVPAEINITQGSQTRAIDLYLEENSAHYPQQGVAIVAEFFDPNYGVLNTYIGTTDANGHVVFNYTAPEVLPNTPLDITFKVLHGQPDLSVGTKVNFIGGQIIDTTNMNLYVTLEYIDANATVPELEEDIDIYVSDDSYNPVEGIVVRALFFDPNYGHLDKYTGETDANGHIKFTYTGPEENPGNDINITFEIVNGSPTKTVNVLLDF